ncbi:Roadblock/LC7 domain, partial [Geosmithia morbida]
ANGYEALEEKLGRLSRKPGVKASIVIDRATGSILKTSGEISALRTSRSRSEAAAATFSNEASTADDSESKGVEEFASMIWNYVNTSGQLAQDLDAEDELKLLRFRTKKQEIVIVPDSKYLLTVVHDTPPV